MGPTAAAMAERAPDGRATTAEPATVLEVLGNAHCRAIISEIGGDALTAIELGEELDVPMSTLYRYLAELVEAGLLTESVRIDPNGRNQKEYARLLGAVTISFDDAIDVEPAI